MDQVYPNSQAVCLCSYSISLVMEKKAWGKHTRQCICFILIVQCCAHVTPLPKLSFTETLKINYSPFGTKSPLPIILNL